MDKTALRARLDQLAADSEELDISAAGELVDTLAEAGGPTISQIVTILQFMESQPDLDFGTPGPLVHFAESYPDLWAYEAELRQSLRSRAIPHTLWMLNRLINGAREADHKASLIAVLKDLAVNSADENVRAEAKVFLNFHGI